jgi:hypothetical protein
VSHVQKKMLCEEIDDFLTTQKWLFGAQPIWRQNGSFDRLDGRWVINEAGDVSRAYLAFRLNRVSTNEPSVTLVFRGKPICRVDIKPIEDSDGNPPQARKFDLPGQVYGPHIHRWDYNREYVLKALPPNEWDIPIKQQISPSTQTLGHILAMICTQCEIEFTPEQRDVTPPTRELLI